MKSLLKFNGIAIGYVRGPGSQAQILCSKKNFAERFLITPKIAYLINLDRRQDRWDEFAVKASKFDIPVERFSAVEGLELPKNELRLPPPVTACWMSHQKVAREFLNGEATHCLVLEDDVDLNQKAIFGLEELWKRNLQHVDLLQIGFCVHHNRLSNRVKHSTQVLLVTILNRLRLLNLELVRRIFRLLYGYDFRRIKQLSQPVAAMTFELGTHAYVMSREFARTIISFNYPVYLPADLAMMELAKTGKFEAFRLIKPLINQNDSPSSISNASLNALEAEIAQANRSWES